MRIYLIFFLFLISCTKELKNEINNLKSIVDSLNDSIANIKLSKSDLSKLVKELEIEVDEYSSLYSSEIIGCWKNESFSVGLTPLFIEITIFQGGIGALDFGGSVYQIFSWSEADENITLHFGEVMNSSSFGVIYNFINDSAYILYGEIFDGDKEVFIDSIDNGTDSITILNWNQNEVIFHRCS